MSLLLFESVDLEQVEESDEGLPLRGGIFRVHPQIETRDRAAVLDFGQALISAADGGSGLASASIRDFGRSR